MSNFAADATDPKQTEQLFRLHLELIEFSATHSTQEVLQKTLDQVGKLIASPIGFFHFVEEDQQTITLQIWSTRTMQEFCKAEGKGLHYSVDEAGVWADAIRYRKPIVHNDYASLPNRKGMPEGHAQVIRELVVPILRAGKVVAILGVGNRPTDYSEKDVEIVGYFADAAWEIANRKRAESALRASEERFRSFADDLPAMICEFLPDSTLTYANKAYAEYFGFTTAELIGRPFLDFLPEEARAETKNAYLSLTPEQPIEVHTNKVIKDGKVRWQEWRNRLLIDDQGNSSGQYQAIGVDITDRKQAEESLRESEERFRTVVEAAPDTIFIQTEGRFVYLNPTALSLFGVTDSNQLLGQFVVSYFHPDCRSQVDERIRLVNQEGQIAPRAVLKILRWGDGAAVDVEASAIPFVYNGKQGAIAFLQDITDRLRAERERAELHAQMQAQAEQITEIMEKVPEGVLLLDGSGQVLLANPAGVRDIETLGGVGVGQRLAYLGDIPLTELLAFGARGGPWREIRYGQRTFEAIARRTTRLLSHVSGASERWVLVINDVSYARDLNRQLLQQQRLAAIGQLAAGIAHDFNNILAVISLHVSMLTRATALGDRDRERLRVLDDQTSHAAQLIQQILDFSRRAVLERQPFDLGPFLKEQAKLLARTLPENIHVDLDCPPGQYVVMADAARIQQLVMNLAVNARDAMTKGGTLRLALSLQETPPRPDLPGGPWVRLTVADTGTGLSPEAQAHLFEPFFTTKPPGQGSGLGLAQVHGIVKQHGGEIAAHSVAGEGCTFTIYLPAEPTSPASPVDAPQQGAQKGGGETILIVEDNDVLREALCDIVEMLGYKVLCAGQGIEALAVLEAQPNTVDLVLSDMIMPEMGGDELLAAMHQRGLAVPMVILSGNPLNHDVTDMERKGLAGWLLKPPNLNELAQLLAQVLEQKNGK